jgi:hypothetical protein
VRRPDPSHRSVPGETGKKPGKTERTKSGTG